MRSAVTWPDLHRDCCRGGRRPVRRRRPKNERCHSGRACGFFLGVEVGEALDVPRVNELDGDGFQPKARAPGLEGVPLGVPDTNYLVPLDEGVTASLAIVEELRQLAAVCFDFSFQH